LGGIRPAFETAALFRSTVQSPVARTAIPSALVVRAPAKLNLFLELLRKRPDGYHELETAMVPVSCFDTLWVRRTATHDDVRLTTHWWPSSAAWSEALGEAAEPLLSIPDDPTNLIHRAITAVKAAFAIESGFDVIARKRIPAGAGMGGASSDAAAAIRAAVLLSGIRTSGQRLAEIAAGIGSDVPFFLGPPESLGATDSLAPPERLERLERPGPTVAIATGRGEKLATHAMPRPLWFVVGFPRGGLSTARVYAAAQVPQQPVRVGKFLDALTAGSFGALHSCLLNRLSHPARLLSPVVGDLLALMESNGLAPALMTGSGSACFCLCENQEQARQRGQRLREAWRRQGSAGMVLVVSSVPLGSRFRWV
jgi:4-diphosphocytidyl-2-C-methyl-D-erythritol kinase